MTCADCGGASSASGTSLNGVVTGVRGLVSRVIAGRTQIGLADSSADSTAAVVNADAGPSPIRVDNGQIQAVLDSATQSQALTVSGVGQAAQGINVDSNRFSISTVNQANGDGFLVPRYGHPMPYQSGSTTNDFNAQSLAGVWDTSAASAGGFHGDDQYLGVVPMDGIYLWTADLAVRGYTPDAVVVMQMVVIPAASGTNTGLAQEERPASASGDALFSLTSIEEFKAGDQVGIITFPTNATGQSIPTSVRIQSQILYAGHPASPTWTP